MEHLKYQSKFSFEAAHTQNLIAYRIIEREHSSMWLCVCI